MKGQTGGRSRVSKSEMLAIVALALALALIAMGSVLAAICFLLAGFMGWTRVFERVRAQNKPALSDAGRAAAAAILVALGAALTLHGQTDAPATQPTVPTFDKLDAVDACKDGVTARASHPSTVEFPTFDYDFKDFGRGQSQLLMSAKMRNGFNLLVEFDVQCDFVSGKLNDVIMSEARSR